MKYALNVPLAVAALCQAWFASMVLVSAPWGGWEDGPSRGAMALVMLEVAAFCWLILLLAMVGAAFTDAFDWLPTERRWLRRSLVAGAAPLIVALVVPCVMVAIEGSGAVGGHDAEQIGTLPRAGALIVAVGLPFVVTGWLAWLIDMPAPRRDAALPRSIGLGALALTALIGGLLGTDMLADEIRIDRATAQRNQQMIDERDAQVREGYARLTDATPLRSWQSCTDRFAPDAMRAAALKRLAARPTLEPDLSEMLRSTDLEDAENALLLVQQIQFKPSAALGPPLRDAMSRIAGRIRTVREPGSGNDFDSYLDSFFGDYLDASLAVAGKMADSAGVDLRDGLHDLEGAVIQAYPGSKSARSYPGEVMAAEQRIDTALAARPKTN
jgi:hypothetical protein